MIQVTPHMRIMLAIEPADFRKGIDGLAGVCRQILSVVLFLFSATGKALQ
jgi:hypothetical protein